MKPRRALNCARQCVGKGAAHRSVWTVQTVRAPCRGEVRLMYAHGHGSSLVPSRHHHRSCVLPGCSSFHSPIYFQHGVLAAFRHLQGCAAAVAAQPRAEQERIGEKQCARKCVAKPRYGPAAVNERARALRAPYCVGGLVILHHHSHAADSAVGLDAVDSPWPFIRPLLVFLTGTCSPTNGQWFKNLAQKNFDSVDMDKDGALDRKELYIALLKMYDTLNDALPCHMLIPQSEEVDRLLKECGKHTQRVQVKGARLDGQTSSSCHVEGTQCNPLESARGRHDHQEKLLSPDSTIDEKLQLTAIDGPAADGPAAAAQFRDFPLLIHVHVRLHTRVGWSLTP
eukprot:351879-Chlamydomonas_euryale.AAC.16